jgi:hypothetical protein
VTAAIELHRSSTQQADLDQYLGDLLKTGSASYHHWLTPEQFAERFQPSATDVDALRLWATSQGLAVESVSRGRTTMQVSGTVAQMNRAFAVQMHAVRATGSDVVTALSAATMPSAIASSVKTVRGLNPLALSVTANSAVESLASQVDANDTPVLVVKADAACGTSDATVLDEAYLPLLEQAAAQGQTVLVEGACVSSALSPAAAALVTAVHLSGSASGTSLALDGTPRPGWQVAEGLPSSAVRAVPDVTSDADALASALRTIVAETGSRQGNVNAVLYSLAPLTNVYTHDAGEAAGSWSAQTGLGTLVLDELIKAWPRGTTSTTVSIASSNYGPAHGTSITLTGTVTPVSSVIPTGTITFSSTQGGTLSTQALDPTTGRATYSTNQLAGGNYDFLATYSGDGTYASGVSNTTANVNVVGEQTQLSGVETNSPVVGQNITVLVTAASASGVGLPSGSATITPSGTSNSTTYSGTLTASGANSATTTISVPTTSAGSFTLLISCTSTNASFTCNTPTGLQAIVGKGTASVAVTYTRPIASAVGARAFPVPVAAATTGTLTATVTGPGVVPAGAVQFYDGTTSLGTGVLNGSGVATLSATLVGAGTHAITGVYNGDGNYSSATSPVANVAGTAVSTTTSLSSTTGYTGIYGTTFTLGSTVTPSTLVNGTAPTGTVTITDSIDGVVGTISLASGAGTIDITSLSVGSHSLVATYSGDTNYAASSSAAAVVISVSAASGTLAATIAPTTAVGYGTTATISATVTSAGGTAIKAGTIQATVNGVAGAVYTGAISGGAATITIPAPIPGSYTITVACAASTNLTCTNTVTLTLRVVAGATTTSVALSPSIPDAGKRTTVTATVVPASATTTAGLLPITGTVVFTDNGISLGSAAVVNGTASINAVFSGGRSHSIVATYAGSTNWAASASNPIAVTPTPIDAAITLTSNTLSPLAGANLTLTARLSLPTGAVSFPTGVVTFYDTLNGTTRKLGSATLISNGIDASVAQLSTTGYAAGAHSSYAVYAGDGTYNTATSAQLAIATGDFTLTMNPQTLVVTRGSRAQATGLLTMVSGFTGAVTLGCTPPVDSATTCSFSPSVISGSGGTTILTISTSTASATPVAAAGRWKHGLFAEGAALALLLGWVMPRRSRRIPGLLLFALLGIFAASATGCASGVLTTTNGGSTGGGGTPVGTGTPFGTMIVTLTTAATDGSTTARHNYSYQVTVQ